MEMMETVGDRILTIRKKLGLNQTEFGALLGGLKKSAISAYEKNDNPLSIATAVQIAELGSISLEELVTGEDPCLANEHSFHEGQMPYLTDFEQRMIIMLRKLDPRDYGAILEFFQQMEKTNPY